MRKGFGSLLAVLTLVACGGGGDAPADTPQDTATAAPAAQSLYDRLGGVDAITAMVDTFIGIAAAGRAHQQEDRQERRATVAFPPDRAGLQRDGWAMQLHGARYAYDAPRDGRDGW
ncbi:MAG: hypothetical protein ACREMQ_15010 [Longimicrobiales bacterium]